jgi:hypothetical protein
MNALTWINLANLEKIVEIQKTDVDILTFHLCVL